MACPLQEQIDRLAALPKGMPRGDFVDAVRALEREAAARLAAESLGRWQSGAGLAVSSSLSDWKDAVIRAVIDRLGGLPAAGDLAVMAVGGYGRGELSPFSDVDLMLLGTRSPDAKTTELISGLLYTLWDLGYRLGSSVRSVREVIADARDDVHLLTSLFTARLVIGGAAPAERVRAALSRDLARSRRRFLQERAAELRAVMRNRAGEVLVKEPNLKTNPGGLRSVHLLMWLAYAFEGESGRGGLARLFAPPELRRLIGAYDFVLFNRNRLHFHTGRREDVLHIGYQPMAAEAFGIRGDDQEKATRLMRRYYEKATDILLLLLQAVDHLTLEHLAPRRRRASTPGCFIADSKLHVSPDASPAADPVAGALDALLECARERVEPSSSLLSYLGRAARELARRGGAPGGRGIDDACRTDEAHRTDGAHRSDGAHRTDGAHRADDGHRGAESRELFLRFREILSLPDSSAALSALELSGFLYVYLGPLRLVRHRIVHNSFHQYTVDQHSIEAVRALESFPALAESDPGKHRLAAELCARYRDNLWVVKLALLLHDAGKAYPGDHAKNGAELARGFLRALPTDSLFKDMVVFLVENHLLLSNLARRGGADDQSVVDHLAGELILTPFPEESLEFLYLMTCADVSATNPRAYSGYAATMLAALFLRAARALGRGTAAGAGAGAAAAAGVGGSEPAEAQARVEELGASLSGQPEGVRDFVRALGPRYCATNAPREIVDDYRAFTDLGAAGPAGPGFALRVIVFNDYLKVKILAPDRIGLFAIMSGILLLSGADIVRADIHTYRDTAIDEFVITGVHGYDILERRMEKELSQWIDDLRRSFETYLAQPAELDRVVTEIERSLKEPGRRPPAAFARETRVSVARGGERGLRIDLSCTDRPALLYDVTKRIASLDCDVRGAVIDTTGWYVRDRFEAEARGPVDAARVQLIEAELRAAAT